MKGQQAASERLSGLAETVIWVVAFCFASTSMTMLNKAAVKALPFPYWLCVLQNIATILLVGAVVSTCVPSGHPTFGLVRSLDWEVVTLWLPAVAMFIVMLVSSLSALHAVSVPTVLVFRSLTPLCTAILESMWLRVRYAWATWASLTLILIGAVCYVIATPRDGDSANNIRRALGASPASILACMSARLSPGACAQGLRVAGRQSVLGRRVPRVRQGHDQQTSALADRHGARREPPPAPSHTQTTRPRCRFYGTIYYRSPPSPSSARYSIARATSPAPSLTSTVWGGCGFHRRWSSLQLLRSQDSACRRCPPLPHTTTTHLRVQKPVDEVSSAPLSNTPGALCDVGHRG